MRGSIAGMTGLSGPSHNLVLRSKSSPVNPATARQVQSSGYFAQAASVWKSCPEAHREGWRRYALPRSGRAAFIASYSFAAMIHAKYPTILVLDSQPPPCPGSLSFSAGNFRPNVIPNDQIHIDLNNLSSLRLMVDIKVSYPISPTSKQNLMKWDYGRSVFHWMDPAQVENYIVYGLQPGRRYQLHCRAVSITNGPQPLILSPLFSGWSYA
jgi:hypothetical protein